ncbi:MAG: TerB family tellurite resistance protein [Gammaproteobacteria bacterium]|nr:TerB family tellurite resistance protein [Gammaproteobacteria bacterium]NND60505.1 TerB family tellurite resistance protein [Gammaproteobacteria bacterium]
MHILLGLLGAIVTLLILLKRLADAGIDLAGLNPFLWRRRRNWRLQVDGDPIYMIENPRDMAAILVVGVARVDGDVTVEEKRAIRQEFEMAFSLDQRGASELIASSVYLLRDNQALHDPAALLARCKEQFSGEQVDSLFEMINRVAMVGGAPSQVQLDYIAALRRELTTEAVPDSTW